MLEVQQLRKVFPNGVVALDGVDLDVPDGDIVGVIGRSGTGKSTLIRCVNRLAEPTAGTIQLEGEDLTRMRGPQLCAPRPRPAAPRRPPADRDDLPAVQPADLTHRGRERRAAAGDRGRRPRRAPP